jgi:hypothetical protein
MLARAAKPFAECAEAIHETDAQQSRDRQRRDLGPREGKDVLAMVSSCSSICLLAEVMG